MLITVSYPPLSKLSPQPKEELSVPATPLLLNETECYEYRASTKKQKQKESH